MIFFAENNKKLSGKLHFKLEKNNVLGGIFQYRFKDIFIGNEN